MCRRHIILLTPHKRSAVWGTKKKNTYNVSKTHHPNNPAQTQRSLGNKKKNNLAHSIET